MIVLADVTVDRGGERVIDGVGWSVAAGEAWALVGRTGSGRRTLLEALAGRLALARGDVIVAGCSLRAAPRRFRRLVGHVPAGIIAPPALRAGEFLEVTGAEEGLAGAALAGAVKRALALAGLDGDGQARLDRIPDGIRKRLLVARALLLDPPVLLIDDPFRGLDPTERRDVERLVGDLVLVERAVVAVVPDADVPGCFTHLAVMRGGRIVSRSVASPAAFPGRSWPVRFVVPGRADDALAVLAAVAADPVARDADTVVVPLAGDGAIAEAVAALVHAEISVAAVGHDGPWAARLLDG